MIYKNERHQAAAVNETNDPEVFGSFRQTGRL